MLAWQVWSFPCPIGLWQFFIAMLSRLLTWKKEKCWCNTTLVWQSVLTVSSRFGVLLRNRCLNMLIIDCFTVVLVWSSPNSCSKAQRKWTSEAVLLGEWKPLLQAHPCRRTNREQLRKWAHQRSCRSAGGYSVHGESRIWKILLYRLPTAALVSALCLGKQRSFRKSSPKNPLQCFI